VRAIIEPLRLRGVSVPAEETALVDELAQRISAFLPTQNEASDDEEYF
jgi:hypothetical protein